MLTMRFTGKTRLGLLIGLAGFLCFVAPKAQAGEEKDPPTRAARISYTDGSVSLRPGGQGDWGSAAKNRPVTIGDKIWVDKDSRAELQAGQAALHLGSMTAVSFLNLDQGITQVRLAEGSLNFRVRELREGDLYEVDAPNLAFTVKQAGAFRIDVNENGDSARVTVLRGEGEVTAGGKTYEVHSGERGEFNGTDNIEYSINRAPGPDGLDRWASERDLKEDNSVSARYVSRDMVGYGDLDDYGTWRDEPEYGHVWYPAGVAPGWAPYSYGYWNWVGPWGWTWVDYAPWGFAPFHYGRWNYFNGGWGWCPGPFFGPPVFGPAFVGFFGGGFGFSVGWFPLGFGEPFFPFFRSSVNFITIINVRNTFIRNVNILNTTNIHNINFVNAHNVNAVTVANRNTFVNGQAINRGAVHLTPGALNGAQVTNSVGLKPTQHSWLGAQNTRSQVPRPTAAVQNRAVIARTAPAQAASHMPVHTVNSSTLSAGRMGNAPVNSAMNRSASGAMGQRAVSPNAPTHGMSAINGRSGNMPSTSGTSTRQRDLSQNRPPSAMPNSARMPNTAVNNNVPQRAGNGPRSWEAQGNRTDRGQAPRSLSSSNRPANAPAQSARMIQSDRPAWARSSQSDAVSSARPQSGFNAPASRQTAPNSNSNRPGSSNSNRSFEPPQRGTSPASGNRGFAQQQPSNGNRSFEPPQRGTSPASGNRGFAQQQPSNGNRGFSQPPSYGNRGDSQPRSYSPPSRSYSAPSRTYSAPSRSYPAPSRSYSAPSRGNGGASSGGSRGGSGSSRSNGGSVSRGSRQ